MESKTQRVEDSVWAQQLKAEMEKQTGRSDIEVTVSPYRPYDSLLLRAKVDNHPIVDFFSAIQGDPPRVEKALNYAVELIQNWGATQVWHDKAMLDCLPLFERLQKEFPDLTLAHSVLDFFQHSVRVERIEGKIFASFDLWPKMTEQDVERVTAYIKDLESTLQREKATVAGVTYFWQ